MARTEKDLMIGTALCGPVRGVVWSPGLIEGSAQTATGIRFCFCFHASGKFAATVMNANTDITMAEMERGIHLL